MSNPLSSKPAVEDHLHGPNDCHTTRVIRIAGIMGVLSLVGILTIAFMLVTGFKPQGSGGVQENLALVVLGALMTIPGNALNGLFGLVGRKDGPAGTEGDPTKTKIVNPPADPVQTEDANG